ncbi:MAG: hypothetical protein QOH38_1897 [Thermoleophilaceae bacterium]|nr:hypothetical protein [Thermoleophilaceae bacterium]
MAGRTDVFDLGRLQLASGQSRQVELWVEIEELEFGGQRYSSERPLTDALLDATRPRQGYALRLRFEAQLEGPCMRCLEDSHTGVAIDAREVDQPGGGEDLSSPYLDGNDLDVRSWARDALALALPAQIVCRHECRGLCAICGENLNEADPSHGHEAPPDPRFAKLADLKFE